MGKQTDYVRPMTWSLKKVEKCQSVTSSSLQNKVKDNLYSVNNESVKSKVQVNHHNDGNAIEVTASADDVGGRGTINRKSNTIVTQLSPFTETFSLT